ncbi:hypothetical protein MHZ92_07975 [Sporosarcina sp. ACRSL]|uniref:hypothetical protein n=1 Tax=Sporosarcina sp. ACRSL TaxID=2918215 RepID=UPI001EF52CF8|nr:hypothetical protein [Sporosarcina sp. ACRSL]MCG7344065.1 hypothetical protein [Sporosarcina sp. ACRSL]
METPSYTLTDKPSFVARYQIEVHPDDLQQVKTENYLFVTVADEFGNDVRCMILSNPTIQRGQAKVSKRCLQRLDPKTKSVFIYATEFQFINRGIPKVDDIKKKFVYASADVIEKYSNNVEIINVKTGFRMKLQLRARKDDTMNKVFINRYHMLLLDIEKDSHSRLVITQSPIDSSSMTRKIIRKVKSFCADTVKVIGNWFIGYRELELRIGYIYPFDESHNVSRIHPNIRKFLGVDENERVVIAYNGKRVKLPILDLDTKHIEEVFKVEDEFTDSHLYIGIPATTRSELDIPNIGTVVKVRRSMKFLLMKHINKLILPIIALWFTIFNFVKADSLENIVKIIILIVTISPIVIFASLSVERSKVK